MNYKITTHYMYNVTHCNYVNITHFQLLCNSIITAPNDVMLTSLIVIHPLKFNKSHYEKIWILFFIFFEILIFIIHYDC